MNKTISITKKSHELLKSLTEKSKRSLIMELEVVLEEYMEMKNKPEPQPQTPVYQPQPQPEPQFYMGMPRDPDMRPQWQLDEIDRLKKEKIKRVNELGNEKDDMLREYMDKTGWTQEEINDIAEGYDQQIKDVEKEIDDKLNAIYENNA